MELKNQKRIAATVAKCSPKRVIFDNERLSEIKEAITKKDINSLIKDRAIFIKPVKGNSRGRLRKKKGKKKGRGSRKGKKNSVISGKTRWIRKVRAQKKFLKILRNEKKIEKKVYRDLYFKVKGGFFRSRRHIKVYLEERGLAENIEINK